MNGATPAVSSSCPQADQAAGHLAPTSCAIAGLPPEPWMEGARLPVDDADAEVRGHGCAVTEWDSELLGVDVHLRTIIPVPAARGARVTRYVTAPGCRWRAGPRYSRPVGRAPQGRSEEDRR